MRRYKFQESVVHLTTKIDTSRKPREVMASSEEGARAHLPKAGFGRIWHLVDEVSARGIPVRDTRYVPVYLGGPEDENRVRVGMASLRTDGVVDVHVDPIRLKEHVAGAILLEAINNIQVSISYNN